MKKLFATLLAAANLAACQKAAPPTAAQDVPPEVEKLAAAAPSEDEQQQVDEPRDQGAEALTTKKLEAFFIYEREMLPQTQLAMGMATGAFRQAGEKMGEALAKDARLEAIQAAQQAALDKAGLTIGEIPPISLLTGAYYPQRALARQAKADLETVSKRVADAKAQGKEPSFMDTAMEQAHRETLASSVAACREFQNEHGAALVKLLDERLDEYVGVQEQRMKMLLE